MCPFCPLLCDRYGVQPDAAGALELSGGRCERAQSALARFSVESAAQTATPTLDGRPIDLAEACRLAADWLRASRQPLLAGLGTDIQGARALYRLAAATGAIADPSSGAALMRTLRALQDRGSFTVTLAEIRTRGDVVVFFGGLPEGFPKLLERCALAGDDPAWASHAGDPLPASRSVWIVPTGAASASTPPPAWRSGIDVRTLAPMAAAADPFDAATLLAALVAGRRVNQDIPQDWKALVQALQHARYGVVVAQPAQWPEHGELVSEALLRAVVTLNAKTRAGMLALGGIDGAASVNQTFAWLSGLPLRSRAGAFGLEHDPVSFDASRLMAERSVDALVWVGAWGTEPPPIASKGIARITIGHPTHRSDEGLFIPVATPGIGSDGDLFRTDGLVVIPLRQAEVPGITPLPSVGDVVGRILASLGDARHFDVPAADAAPATDATDFRGALQ